VSSLKKYGRYGTVGLELIFSMGIGFFAGQWLDRRYFGNKGYATLIGFGIGLVAGFRNLFRVARIATREADAEEARERDGSMEYQEEYLEIARKPGERVDAQEAQHAPASTASSSTPTGLRKKDDP